MSLGSRASALVALACVSAAPLAAQSPTATLSARVIDSLGVPLPGAAVMVRAVETGQARDAVSGPDGTFRLLALNPGPHQVRVALTGFDGYASDLMLAIGQEANLVAVLAPAKVRETVTVMADRIGTTRTAIGNLTLREEMEQLPVPRREFTNLVFLTPGILLNQLPNSPGTRIVSTGQTGRSNAFLIDGLSLDDPLNGNVRGTLPMDAVREFLVMANGYTVRADEVSGFANRHLIAGQGLFQQARGTELARSGPGSHRCSAPRTPKTRGHLAHPT
jgi:hypothetical protein